MKLVWIMPCPKRAVHIEANILKLYKRRYKDVKDN